MSRCRHGEVYSDGTCVACFQHGKLEGVAQGRAEERAEIAAWLNDLVVREPWSAEQPRHPLAALSIVAGMITRGEHIKTGDVKP